MPQCSSCRLSRPQGLAVSRASRPASGRKIGRVHARDRTQRRTGRGNRLVSPRMIPNCQGTTMVRVAARDAAR